MGYQEKKQIVLDELEKSLGAVKEEEVEQFVDMIGKTICLFCQFIC